MAAVYQFAGPANASYQTAPLDAYSQEHQDLAQRVFVRIGEIVGSDQPDQPKHYKGSYSVLAATSSATVAKIIIYESEKGRTNGDCRTFGTECMRSSAQTTRSATGFGVNFCPLAFPPNSTTRKERVRSVSPPATRNSFRTSE